MKRAHMTATCLLMSAAVLTCSAGPTSADVTIRLGDRQRVTDLYSFPNNCSTVCCRPWTLEQTVEHYLNASLRRDGFANTTATLYLDNGIYFARLSGPEPAGFLRAISRAGRHGACLGPGISTASESGAMTGAFFFPSAFRC